MNNNAYAAALAEIEEGRLDKGTWARAFAESGGDESNAKARYIKGRAELIDSSPTWSDTQPPIEEVTKKRIEPKTSGGTGWSAVKLGEYYEAAIGEKSSGYYTEKFHTFDKKGPGLHASWNWSAFFFTGFWAFYRKMYAWFFAWWAVVAVGGVLFKVPNPKIEQGVALAYIACLLAFAAYANALYHRKVKVKIADAKRSISDPSRLNEGMSAGSGVNKWVPFVCGAIPVVGIVAAVALPAYQDYSKRRAMAAMPVRAPAPLGQPFEPFTGKLDSPASIPGPQVDWDKSVIVPNVVQTGPDWDKDVITTPENASAQDLYLQKVRAIQEKVKQGELSSVNGTTSLEPPKNLSQWPNAESLKLEQWQTWWRNKGNQFNLHVQNTTPYELTTLALDFGQQGCESAVARRRFYVALRQVVTSGSQALLSFSPPISISSTPNNCLVVSSAWQPVNAIPAKAQAARLATTSNAESAKERADNKQVQADLDAIAARAVSDFPYLDTPAGQEVLNKIVQKRDEYIRQGQYPSVALTNAVNDFAPANAPRPNQEKRHLPVSEPGDKGNHTGFDQKCRWVTPQDWSCK